jgi:hypothetical protein
VQISPPLVARQEEFDQIVGILGDVLAEAWKRVTKADPSQARTRTALGREPGSRV